MRTFFVVAAATVALASPASARGPGPYVGLEGGILFPRDLNYQVDSVRVQTVPTGSGLLGQTVTTTSMTFGSGFSADYKRGVDVDAIAGYRFGLFRVEGELGYKRARIGQLSASPTLLGGINTAPISGVTSDDFSFGDRTTILSAMLNGLIDLEVAPGVSVYGGGGVGKARVKAFRDRDSAMAFQLIAGVSKALSPNIDVGLKYRYFQTRDLRFDTAAAFAGTGGSSSASSFSSEGRFRSHSALVGLTFHFGGSDAPIVAPAPVEAAPPPPPPAMQTCADGTVIEASAICPTPPPPPPAVGPERG
jgi:opacity protein-like surface antigen